MGSAFTFPGMGTQKAGMGQDLYDRSETFRTEFDRLDAAVEFDLRQLCFDLTAEKLKQPQHGEPAIVAIGYCTAKAVEADGTTPDYVGGPSLGNFTALAVTGAIDPEEMVSLVRRRGELIDEHSIGNGTMTAVITDTVDRIIDQLAGYDSLSIGVRVTESSCVVGGEAGELEAFLEVLRETAPFVETIPIEAITEAYHSPLLEPVVPLFEDVLREYEFQDAFRYPVVSDRGGVVRTDAEGIRDELCQTLTEPSRMDALLETMRDSGVETYLQMCPPGRLSTPLSEIHPSGDLVEPAIVHTD